MREAGLAKGPTELIIPQTSRADMLLTVPPEISLQNTILDFLRAVNIIEFKSENDELNKSTFADQMARVLLWYSENSKTINLKNMLNVIISSRYPREVFNLSEELGCPFTQVADKEWLWQAKCGWQDVIVMVCERLPIEPEYYGWLDFAPSDTQKWRDYLTTLIGSRNWQRLEAVRRIRPKEVAMTAADIDALLKQYSPEEIKRLNEDWVAAFKIWSPTADPKYVAQIFADWSPEKLASLIPPEKYLATLSPEERVAGLSPEVIAQLASKQAKPEDGQAQN